MKYLLHHGALFGCLFLSAGTLSAQVRTDDFALRNPDPRRCSFYGVNTASEGEWLMAGTYTCTGTGQHGQGSMAVFRRGEQGYQLHQVLSPDAGPGQYFMGESGVDLSGSILVASCPTWPDQLIREGKAFVYEQSGGTWSLTGELVMPPPVSPDSYATDVATDGETVFVGARSAGPSVAGVRTVRGAIYFYKKIGGVWIEIQHWTPPNNSTFDYALAGNRMAADEQVLAWGSELLNTLFIMEPNSNGVWDLVATIPSFTPRLDYNWDIEVDGETIVVGVEDELSQGLGMVHVVNKVAGTWTMVDTLQIPDPNGHGSAFGYSVDLQGDRLAIGAPHAGDLGGGHRSPGAAYLFERDAGGIWNYQYKFVRPDGVMWDMLGTSVSVGDDYLLVGDRGGRVPPAFVNGSAFVFQLPLGQETCNGINNSTGSAARVEVLGSGEAATNWVTLRAENLPRGAFGYFLGSQTQGWLPGVGGSQGNLCLGGTLFRFNRQGQWGAASFEGRSEMRLNTTDPLQGSIAPIQAGQSWTFQFWYRDRNPTPTTNFSSATEVLFR